jgi:hypothetical protein
MKNDYLNWVLSEVYTRNQECDCCANWLVVGLCIGALLVWLF